MSTKWTPKSEMNFDEYMAYLKRFGPKTKAAAERGIARAADKLMQFVKEEIANAQPHPAIASGAMIESVVRERDLNGYSVSVLAPHAAPINNGTRPFYPPLQPLIDWVVRKGLNDSGESAESIARAVQYSIGQHGIAPRRFMEKANARLKPSYVKAMVTRELNREFKGSGGPARVATRGTVKKGWAR